MSVKIFTLHVNSHFYTYFNTYTLEGMAPVNEDEDADDVAEPKNLKSGLKWTRRQMRRANIDTVAELARRGGFDASALNHLFNNTKNTYGLDLVKGIARGLGVLDVVAAKEFGLLDGDITPDEKAVLFTQLLNTIPDPTERDRAADLVETLLRQIAEQVERSQDAAKAPKTGRSGTAQRRSNATG